jgi:predicted ATP-dependent serine protease
VTGLEARLKEAAALGFGAAVVPQSSLSGVAGLALDVQGVGSVDEAVKVLLGP